MKENEWSTKQIRADVKTEFKSKNDAEAFPSANPADEASSNPYCHPGTKD